MTPETNYHVLPYSQAVRARDVALSLKWIVLIAPEGETGLYRVTYVGKCS